MANEEPFSFIIKTLQGLCIKPYNSPPLEELASRVIKEQLFKVASQECRDYLKANNVNKQTI